MDSTTKIDQLIDSVNSAAAHARTLVVSLLFIALIMGAMVVGTTDEAMLRNSVDVAPELGVQISVSLAHLFAPIILLFLHVGALIQLDILDARHLLLQQALKNAIPLQSARKQHRGRIDGMADAYLLTKDEDDANPSLLRRMMAWLSIVWIPLLVLLAVQISFVRYQHNMITGIQAAALIVDGFALLCFFRRSRKRRNQTLRSKFLNVPIKAAIRTTIWIAIALFFFFASFNARPPADDEVARNVRWNESRIYTQYFGENTTPRQSDDAFPDATCPSGTGDAEPIWWDVTGRPLFEFCNLLDTYLCPHIGWGCRYLDLSNRTQIAGDISSDLIDAIVVNSREFDTIPNPSSDCEKLDDNLNLSNSTLITAEGSADGGSSRSNANAASTPDGTITLKSEQEKKDDLKDAKLRHEFHIGTHGLKLRDRKLRFANFKDAVLVGADLINANLRGANFEEAYLVQAWMESADLSGAMLDDAFLEGVSLEKAILKGASLREAHLQRINLVSADLTCARPDSDDDPGCTVLSRSDMTGADLRGADLTGAKLKQVTLIDANLWGTTLADADLYCSYLRNVDLTGASLHGAELENTTWKKVRLSGVWFAPAETKGSKAEDIDLDAATIGYLRVMEGKLPPIADAAANSADLTMPLDAEAIANGLKDVACKETEIGGGMVWWVIAAQSVYLDARRNAVIEAIQAAFGQGIKNHLNPGPCPGLADLDLTPDQRKELGLDPPAD